MDEVEVTYLRLIHTIIYGWAWNLSIHKPRKKDSRINDMMAENIRRWILEGPTLEITYGNDKLTCF